ncbi:protein kinase domain-containing protein [Anaeromyxobacter oryzae]|uniref:Protein kinase domain-containing protein n=1 Tax=Anaeromyxobacter oryzae TaxID=2918170 RepID=A0ABN6MWJ1_9BACT|nr:serine/threonine-protein kinase [Anaeromyxobacter oryzae]BDG04083.1 hypothetical protein AMOR_30790 [Anaeromyxobacter oryzae]
MANREAHGRSGPRGLRSGALSALLEELARTGDAAHGSWDRALRPGAVIGRFELVREVGRGGFGVVYEARDLELGRTVAFKALFAGDRPDVREERLLREAEAAARLSHPNVVTLHDVGRSEHGPYLVLELLRGETLAARLAYGPLPVREALRIAVDVAKGLAHAHAAGVVHRDLTPGNVYLCDDGQVKVLDLGMAHAFGRRKLDGGTPEYMAPEQWRGAPEDERTDVFALGVILYQMLAGAPPFPADGGRSLQDPRPAPVLEVAHAPGLGALVARMLEKDPVRRPRDGREVQAALAAFERELNRAPPGAAIRVRARRPWRRRRWAAALAAAVALALVGIGAAAVRSARAPRVAGAAASLAVLPFVNLSAEREQAYLSDGLAAEIRAALARLPGLYVVGRASSASFEERSDDARAVGRALGVRAVLAGTVCADGPRLRVTAQLVDVARGTQVWSGAYDRELAGVPAVQAEIAAAVADALGVRAQPGAPLLSPAAATNSAAAHAQLLLGERLLAAGTVEATRRAVGAFENALALDPSYAPAQARLATALGELAVRASGDDRRALAERALAAADGAVALAPTSPEGHAVRGRLRTALGWDWAEAGADLERALALDPRDPETLAARGMWLADQGRLREAIAELRRALERDPMSAPAWARLGAYQLATGDRDGAAQALGRALAITPGQPLATYHLAVRDVLAGKPTEALPLFSREPRAPYRLAGLAIAHHAAGNEVEAACALEALVSGPGRDAPYAVALVLAARGERDRAFEWLERAWGQRDEDLHSAKAEPLLAALHGDPRWGALLRRMHLPVE